MEDLAFYVSKNHQLVHLAPYVFALDQAAPDGWIFTSQVAGLVSDADVDYYLDDPTVDDYIKRLVVEVYGDGTGNSQWALAGAGVGAITIAPPPSAPNLTPRVPVAPPSTLPPPNPAPIGPKPVLPWGTIAGTALGAAFNFGIGFKIGWDIGSDLRDRFDAQAPQYVLLVDPYLGTTKSVPGAAVEQYDQELWSAVIATIVDENRVPTPVELQVSPPPNVYVDINGQWRDSCTGELIVVPFTDLDEEGCGGDSAPDCGSTFGNTCKDLS